MKVWQWSLILGGVVVMMLSLISPERDTPKGAEKRTTGHELARDSAAQEAVPAAAVPGLDKVPAAAEVEAKVRQDKAPPKAPNTQPEPDNAPQRGTVSLPNGGPVDVLKRAYQSSSADGAAAEAEAQIRLSLDNPNVRIALEAVTCHAKVCRVRTSWTPETSLSYMALHMLIGRDISTLIGIDALTDEEHPERADVEVYIARKGLEIDDLN